MNLVQVHLNYHYAKEVCIMISEKYNIPRHGTYTPARPQAAIPQQ